MKKMTFTIALIFCFSLIVQGQTNFSFQIFVNDDEGNTDTLTLGLNTSATYGIDTNFNEIELPPFPPGGVFDARFVDIPGRTATHGQGLPTDIRPVTDDLQRDTFKIRFQSGSDVSSSVTFRWPDGLELFGGGRWRFCNSLSPTAPLIVDMVKNTSVTVDNDDYSTIYITKGDSISYRSFSLATLALDTDNKNKKGKAIPKKSNQVEFCLTIPNNEPVHVNGLFVQFKTPVDSSTLTVSPFVTFVTDHRQKSNAKTKFWFSGATIDTGALVTICGYGVKYGTKEQGIASWYVSNNGIIQGKKKTQKIGVNFTQNQIQLPMPNTINVGEQIMLQAFPNRTDFLTVGSLTAIHGVKKDTFRYVEHKKYSDVLKSLIKDYGKKGYKLQDTLPDCLTHFDDARNGYRYYKKIIKSKLKTLPPDKHRNKLFGEALVLKFNILASQTQKTPAGFGELLIDDWTSPFNGMTVDTLSIRADEYLTFCSISSMPAVTADELADLIANVNGAFDGPMDTLLWSGGKIELKAARAIGDVGFLKRNPGVPPKIIPELSGVYEQVPEFYELEQNYPNPFNPATTIEFTLPEEAFVSIKVHNVLGQEIASLATDEQFTEGTHEVSFNAQALPSGVYFYRIMVNDTKSGRQLFQQTRKMMLVK